MNSLYVQLNPTIWRAGVSARHNARGRECLGGHGGPPSERFFTSTQFCRSSRRFPFFRALRERQKVENGNRSERGFCHRKQASSRWKNLAACPSSNQELKYVCRRCNGYQSRTSDRMCSQQSEFDRLAGPREKRTSSLRLPHYPQPHRLLVFLSVDKFVCPNLPLNDQ